MLPRIKKSDLILLLVTLAMIFIVLEVGFRFLPVNQSLVFSTVDQQQPYFKSKLRNQEVTASYLWDFEHPQHKHINNDGFVNKLDYHADETTPLLAVVGDSYVEALQVADGEAFFDRLSEKHSDKRVYSFGFSGAGLSQYLIWAKYAQEKYHPDALIINVVGNDFDESLKKYKWAPGFYHYVEQADHQLKLERNDYHPKAGARVLINDSALLRYLVYNLQVLDRFPAFKTTLKSWFVGENKEQQFVGNVALNVAQARIDDSLQAVDAFLRDLPQYSGLQPNQVMIVIDGIRESIYQPELKTTYEDGYFAKMRAYLIKQAQAKGFQVLDLQPVFQQEYAKRHQKFEFINDGHWNAYGHQVVSQAIEDAGFLGNS